LQDLTKEGASRLDRGKRKDAQLHQAPAMVRQEEREGALGTRRWQSCDRASRNRRPEEVTEGITRLSDSGKERKATAGVSHHDRAKSRKPQRISTDSATPESLRVGARSRPFSRVQKTKEGGKKSKTSYRQVLGGLKPVLSANRSLGPAALGPAAVSGTGGRGKRAGRSSDILSRDLKKEKGRAISKTTNEI